MKNCLRCKKEFEPINPKGKFCSPKCRVYFSREKKETDKQIVVEKEQEVVNKNDEILAKIKAIKEEKIPDYRNKSSIGRKSWEIEQHKKIEELKKQLTQ